MLLNGVLSGAEIAIVSVRKTRLRELAEGGSAAARAVQRLRGNPERFLATVQIGITVVSATAAAFGGSRIAAELEPVISRVPGLAPSAPELALALVVTLISYLSLVLGELVPKSLALRSSERYALFIGRPLVALASIARPVVWFLTLSSNGVLRLFRDRTNFMEARISPEELQQLVGEAASDGGTLDPTAARIASRALEFPDLLAADVMVPRRQVTSLSIDATPAEVRALLSQVLHTRLPVYDGDVDNVVGYVSLKDLLLYAWDQRAFQLRRILRKAPYVPEGKRALDLLEGMRRDRLPFAIVVDEHGGFSGIVTLEDLVEELVGEIFTEHERRLPEGAHPEPDGTWHVLGTTTVRDLNHELGLGLPEDGDWTTVAGLVLFLAARIPRRGEWVVTPDGTRLEVVDASPRRVRAVRIHPAPPAAEEAEAGAEPEAGRAAPGPVAVDEHASAP